MPYTVPNQRLISIHREHATSDFLGIKNENWQAAARDLGAHALMLYLYFAANADNFKLALSPVAVFEATGMPKSTYRDQFLKLVNKGYLVQRRSSNVCDFYETPQHVTHSTGNNAPSEHTSTEHVQDNTQGVCSKAQEDVEINKTNINSIINNREVGRGKKPFSNQFVF